MRCQVGREMHASVDERVGDQDTEQDRPRQFCRRGPRSVCERVRTKPTVDEPSCRRRTKSTTLPGAAAGPSGTRFRRRAGALPFATIVPFVRPRSPKVLKFLGNPFEAVASAGACVRRWRENFPRTPIDPGLGRRKLRAAAAFSDYSYGPVWH